ncbi:putative ATP synthase subunit f, mitochondrial [Argopecten irradians]|uniref:putative ATP synthase subunit f, mitochondrial n=1 Tax=Argopecten irradians TaxID=31199 RepID=UPI0037130E9C
MSRAIYEAIKEVGKYDPLYNPRVHGTFNPSRYYGKPDKPIMDVKMKELPSWIWRRNCTPIGAARAVGRGFWSFKLKYISCKNGNWKVLPILCLPVAINEARDHFHHVFDKRKYH